MKAVFWLKQFFFGMILLCVISPSQATKPLWSFTPLTPTTISILVNGTATVAYTVTNQSHLPHTLKMTPIAGISQVSIPGATCADPFFLTYKQSCILVLQVTGSALRGNVVGGPVVCEMGNPLQCYQPSLANSLNITVEGTAEYTVGGNASGLVGTVVLQNGSDTLTLSSDGSFTFPTTYPTGSAYNVTVQTNPAGQTCTVSDGAGVITNSNVTDVVVTCADAAFTVGGTVSGLVGTLGLRLNDTQNLSIVANGSYTFPDPIAQGSPYEVIITSKPPAQTCTLSNSQGVMGGANVTNVNVTCSTTTYTLGGTISGLVGTVVLRNANQTVSRSTNGVFTFPEALANGSPYAVIVESDPAEQTCTVTNGTGTVSGANVTNVTVTCVTNATTLSIFTPRSVIQVGGVPGGIIVRNTGATTATNVHAVLPPAWVGVVQDATACTNLLPNTNCTLTFTSATEPYVAQGSIAITGDNIAPPVPTVALAFSLTSDLVNYYLVFSVNSQISATVVDSVNGPVNQWGNNVPTNATSLTDGFSNTTIIKNTPNIGSSAAVDCSNSTNGGAAAGTWYLPAICQLINDAELCSPGTASIKTNLYNLGFLSISPSDVYWSSTEFDFFQARAMRFSTTFAFVAQKFAAANARCVRSMPY